MSRTYRKSKWDRLSREEYEKRFRHINNNYIANRIKWNNSLCYQNEELNEVCLKEDMLRYDEKNRDWHDPLNWQHFGNQNYKAFHKEVKTRIRRANKRLCKKVIQGHEINKSYPHKADFKYLLWIVN